MTRTLILHHLGIIYQIKLRTIPNSDHSSIVIWCGETALTGASCTGYITNKEAKIKAERMIEEYWDNVWSLFEPCDIIGRIGTGLCY